MKQKTETPHRGQTVQGGMVINYNFRAENINTKSPNFENSIGWQWPNQIPAGLKCASLPPSLLEVSK